MNKQHTKAILLKRINYGEADRILTVITPDNGRLSLLAKGARKQKSKLAGGIELFSESEITYVEGRSELKTIISTRLGKYFDLIVKDVQKTMLAYDFLKAIQESTQHGVEQGTYELLFRSLEYLNINSANVDIASIWFTVHMLELDGSGINLEKPLNSSAFKDSESYEYSYDDRSFLQTSNGTYKPAHIKFLRLCAKAITPEKLTVIQNFESIAGKLAPLTINILKMHKT